MLTMGSDSADINVEREWRAVINKQAAHSELQRKGAGGARRGWGAAQLKCCTLS
jgi:hypothetical protein